MGPPPVWAKPLERCIGSGGFAAVWQISGSDSVLKVAHANHELARARMAREAEALGAVGAPAVPTLFGSGVLPDGRAWIEMAKVSGTNLGDIIASGSLRVDHVIALGIRIAEALMRIHDAGYAHRDLKPDNIVRRADGSLVILDLGLARKLPDDPDDPNRAGVQVGSVEYMAPEQALDGTTARAPADVYALGCILYELCTGRVPFVGDAQTLERAHAALRPPPPSALANIPPALDAVTLECLAKQPARRPPSAMAVADRLREVRDDGSQRTQHSLSVIGGGKQPVVLLWAELPKVDRALLATLTTRKVAIVSQRGRRVLGGVAGIEHADPAAAAIAAARDLAAAGARVALHLDAVTVTPGPGGITLAGPSVEKPETWLPAGAWTGVVMTRTLATITQLPTRPTEVAGFVTLGDANQPSEQLFGRDALISDVVAEAATALSGIGPGLALLVGDHGIGKTVLARELAGRLAAELDAYVVSGTIPPPGSGRPGYSALADLVGPAPQGPIVRAVGDAIRTAARRRPLAIILDELHLAEHELLDALEYATLGGESLPLWIVGFASPRLDQRRPGFGQRAERRMRLAIPPLDEDAAVAMTAELLRPAEYPPLRALRQIAGIARGNPMHLATLVRELHDRGAIRTRPNGEHFLDTTTLDNLPPIALGPWLAARDLANLGDELVSLARVCAILGDDISRDELAGVTEIAEQRGTATTSVDLDVGLKELVSHGMLIAGRDGWSFRQTLLEEGIYTTTDETSRRAFHACALAYWQTKPQHDPAVAERVSRHAEAIGDRRAAASAFAVLGEAAHRDHRTLDADQSWQGAVRNLDAPDLERGRALLGRARARYRLQRVHDAVADLDEVLAIADALGNRLLEVEALIEKATALDWGDKFDESAVIASAARARLEDAPDSLALDIDLAEGRSLFRLQKFVEAAPHLRRVMGAAHDRNVEVETIAGVLLGPTLVELGDLDEAETVFANVIELCERTGDRLHFGAAHANRAWLWSKRGEVEQNANDLRVVIQVARENGQAALERIATYNLAEDRLWQGALDEAAQLARRSLAIQRGHGEGDDNLDLVLLARVLAARNDREELATIVSRIALDKLSDADRRVLDVLACVRDRADDATWQLALAGTADLPSELRLELIHLAHREGHVRPHLRDQMREVARLHPIWARRSEL